MNQRTALNSVFMGRDCELLGEMFAFYAPEAQVIVDVTCNARRMWAGSKLKVLCCDIDPAVKPDVVCSFASLPLEPGTVDVLVYDPPHLPLAAASPRSVRQYKQDYGLARSVKGNNVTALHAPFLEEAKRVLVQDGLIFAKIKDYVHNHRYQWNLEEFNAAVRATGLTPCDLIVKRDPAGGNLKSGRWQKSHHVRNVHCYWVVVRKGRCEARPR